MNITNLTDTWKYQQGEDVEGAIVRIEVPGDPLRNLVYMLEETRYIRNLTTRWVYLSMNREGLSLCLDGLHHSVMFHGLCRDLPLKQRKENSFVGFSMQWIEFLEMVRMSGSDSKLIINLTWEKVHRHPTGEADGIPLCHTGEVQSIRPTVALWMKGARVYRGSIAPWPWDKPCNIAGLMHFDRSSPCHGNPAYVSEYGHPLAPTAYMCPPLALNVQCLGPLLTFLDRERDVYGGDVVFSQYTDKNDILVMGPTSGTFLGLWGSSLFTGPLHVKAAYLADSIRLALRLMRREPVSPTTFLSFYLSSRSPDYLIMDRGIGSCQFPGCGDPETGFGIRTAIPLVLWP